MEITWHGNTCFTFRGKKSKLVINPDGGSGDLTADVVLSSLKKGLVDVKDALKVFDWPGEYEMKDMPIIGFRAWTKSKSKEEKDGEQGENTIIFYFEIDEIKCCHLGGLGHVLTSDMVQQIGDVDVLMVDMGENSNLNAKKADEIIEAIEPRAVIPMGEGSFTKALKEFGADKVEAQDKFTIKSSSELPEDKRTYIVLNKQ